jgi:hypothetical protein
MNINTLLGSNTASTAGLSGSTAKSSQATATSATSAPLLAKAGQRIQTDVDSTTAQLSKFGLLKSALAGAQGAAKAVAGLTASSSASDTTLALGTFFNSYNGSVSAANAAGAASASGSASGHAKRVVQDLKAALREPGTDAALKKLGLSVQSDGMLVQDAKKFANALSTDPAGVRAAMATVGKKVDAVNSRELASDGSVGTALAGLSQHSTVLTAQQKAMKTLQQAMAAYQSNTGTT